jgi:hypothetical protein
MSALKTETLSRDEAISRMVKDGVAATQLRSWSLKKLQRVYEESHPDEVRIVDSKLTRAEAIDGLAAEGLSAGGMIESLAIDLGKVRSPLA